MATPSKSTSKAKPAAKTVAVKKATPAKKEAAPKVVASKSVHISEEAIRNRAIEIYHESGCIAGRDLENWTQAEHELKGKKK